MPMHYPIAAALPQCISTCMCEVTAVIIGTAVMHVYVKYWIPVLGTDESLVAWLSVTVHWLPMIGYCTY